MVYCNTLPSQYDVKTASLHIDVLTFNRIVAMGWENLTPFQQRIISEVCERLAIFEFEHKHELDGNITSLSVSGLSMSFNNFDSDAYYKEAGVVIKSSDYDLLVSTGLCSRIL